jgi:hypothetical protein
LHVLHNKGVSHCFISSPPGAATAGPRASSGAGSGPPVAAAALAPVVCFAIILKIKKHSEYNHQIQWKAKHVLPFQKLEAALALRISNLLFDFFLDLTVLIQDPAHINNFIFPAMALRRILCLASVCLHVQVYCPEVGAVITRIQSSEAALTD